MTMIGGCCVCSDERGWDENPLVYCDGQGCNVAVHQACYGIVTVPSGPWFCRKCESQERSARVKCDLCPSRDGALKRTDQAGWAHVVCALYIPEVRFGNVTTMEPILISLIPPERFGRSCYICEINQTKTDTNNRSKATAGACMQCNKPGCKVTFHVTCAQMQGLLCEEAGLMDNVKYCGYCGHHFKSIVDHYGKLKTTRNMKIIPPFRPVPNATVDSSPEKGGKPGSTSDEKLSTTSLNSLSRNNTPIGVGDYIPAKKTGSSNSVSPDIDSSSSKISKNNKKSSGSHSSGKSSDSSLSSKSSNNAPLTPKISQPILTPATFSAVSHSNKNLDDKETEEKSVSDASQGSQSVSKKSGKESDTSKDDSFTVKLERVDNPLLAKGASTSKKDFSTLQLKEVVTAALDRPMSSKFDHVNSGVTSGMDPSSNAGGTSSSHSSSRHSHHGDKPAPPDIKPHVTLTPIPMRGSGSSSRTSLTRGDSDDREEKEKDSSGPTTSKNKSPVGSSMQFHSFGQKLTNAESLDINPKLSKYSDINSPNEIPSLDKSAPPAKRPRGASKDDDRGRKTPTKGRGGRRGSSHSGYGKRDTFNDENSNEPMDIVTSNTSRGGRSGPGRKPGGSRLMGRQTDDPPAPTLSQLKAQMESSAGGDGGTSTNVGGVLPSHMFGNTINPASSMAQRMVDTLSQEMEAVAGAVGISDIVSPTVPVVGIPLPGKCAVASAIVNGTSSSTSSITAPTQTLEQLLERQWEQGSQFLMEQAQWGPLDIAQLLSCLNQLKQDNRALEEHVQTLQNRRDQLIAINARLSIPLGNSSVLGPLGPVFNNSVNSGLTQNGHATPPPNLSSQVVTSHSNVPKGLQVNPSTPSPQQPHELMMQSTRHGHREERIYHSEMQVSRAEITVARPTSSPHGHGQQSLNRQNVAPYGYNPPNNPGGVGPHHSHPSSHHSHNRDGSR